MVISGDKGTKNGDAGRAPPEMIQDLIPAVEPPLAAPPIGEAVAVGSGNSPGDSGLPQCPAGQDSQACSTGWPAPILVPTKAGTWRHQVAEPGAGQAMLLPR